MKIDSLTADVHFTTHQITAEQIMNDQRRDAALPARRVRWIPDRVTCVRRERVRTPRRPDNPLNASQSPYHHGRSVPQPTDNETPQAQKVTCVAASPWLASAPTAHAQIRQICTGRLSMVPEIQLTVVSQSADLHFFVWLEPVQPEQCRYQRNALTPTFLTYTQQVRNRKRARATLSYAGQMHD